MKAAKEGLAEAGLHIPYPHQVEMSRARFLGVPEDDPSRLEPPQA
jgi:hypothetical protein